MNSCTEFDVTTDLPLFTTLRPILVGKPFLNTQAFDHLTTTTNMMLLSCYETFETLIQVLRLTSWSMQVFHVIRTWIKGN